MEGRLQRHVLHSFALREPRQRLLQDHLLEVRRLLVRLERGFVAETECIAMSALCQKQTFSIG